jgi:Protein of unknown function (DUF2695)
MSHGDRPEDTYMDDIAPDVMRVLEKNHFFEKLDNRPCPIEDSENPVDCHAGSFEISGQILCDLGMKAEDVEDVVAVLHSKGACCDCEVLYNIFEESRLKARYWKARHTETVR